MDGLIQIVTNAWNEGFLGIGVTKIIVLMLIFVIGATSRAFLIGKVLRWLEGLTAQTASDVDAVLLESL